MTRRRLIAVGTALLLAIGVAGAGWWWQESRRVADPGVARFLVDDPPPEVAGDAEVVGSAGGAVRLGTVEVQVPPGAVTPGGEIRVLPVAAAGQRLDEIFGQPVGVEHSEPLGADVTLRWSVPELTERQRATAVLARWMPNSRSGSAPDRSSPSAATR